MPRAHLQGTYWRLEWQAGLTRQGQEHVSLVHQIQAAVEPQVGGHQQDVQGQLLLVLGIKEACHGSC